MVNFQRAFIEISSENKVTHAHFFKICTREMKLKFQVSDSFRLLTFHLQIEIDFRFPTLVKTQQNPIKVTKKMYFYKK